MTLSIQCSQTHTREITARLSACALALGLLSVLAFPLSAKPTRVTYVLVVGDKKEPLAAITEKLLADTSKKPVRVGETKLPKGEFIPDPPFACMDGERLHIYVEAGPYLGTTVECAVRLSVTLTSWTTMQALLDFAHSGEQHENYGVASLAISEVVARLNNVTTADFERTLTLLNTSHQLPEAPSDASQLIATIDREMMARHRSDEESQKQTLSYKLWQSAGKYLGVDTPSYFDPSTSKFVMSREAQKALMKYQASNRLKVSGQLDYSTLRDFAKIDVGEVLAKHSAQME